MTTWKRSPLCGTAPEHALHVLETILIDLGCVNQFKAQSSGAMRQTANVFRTTDCSDDLRCE